MNDALEMLNKSGALNQVSQMLGVDEKDTVSAFTEVLPNLVKGMQGQASNKETQQGFLQALTDHSKDNTDDIKSFIKGVDTEDGAKIVQHLLGSQTEEVAAKAQKKSGLDMKTVLKIMAIAAPILMSQTGKTAQKTAKEKGSGDMANIVGGLLDGIDTKDVIKIVGKMLK